MPSVRRPLARLGAITAALLLLTGCSSAPAVTPSGQTTEVTVTVEGMMYVPDVIEVPVGDNLVVTFENTGTDMHDLVFDNGKGSVHLAPGDSQVIEVGVIGEDMDAWCSVSNHRQLGMVLVVKAVG